MAKLYASKVLFLLIVVIVSALAGPVAPVAAAGRRRGLDEPLVDQGIEFVHRCHIGHLEQVGDGVRRQFPFSFQSRQHHFLPVGAGPSPMWCFIAGVEQVLGSAATPCSQDQSSVDQVSQCARGVAGVGAPVLQCLVADWASGVQECEGLRLVLAEAFLTQG